MRIATVKERMLYDVTRFEVDASQPVELEFINPDATPHNLVIVKPARRRRRPCCHPDGRRS